MAKEARPDHPVHKLIQDRWSPYSFADRPVSDEDLRSLLEAARWAPSSYNEQPWRYVLATKRDPDQFERALSCLVDANQAWARHAPVLLLGCVSRKFARNGKPNKAAEHDLGLAAGNLSAEATARGLHVHQMIGILPDKAREVFGIPDDHEAVTALAIGYAGPNDELDPDVAKRDDSERQRRPLAEFVFGAEYGKPADLVG